MQTKFWGKVIKGDKRGKALGFPTANIRLHKKIGQGVYISRIVIDNNTYNSVTFIGNAKTFGKLDIKSETYILDFNKNIYGKRGNITLLKKIRTNQKFESAEKLILQMNNDLEVTKKYFNVGEKGLEPSTSRSQTARSTN